MKDYLKPFLSWKILISYGIPWMAINGWAWIGTVIIPIVGMNPFSTVASTWLAILWLPCTPEKLVIIPIALWIHTKLFLNDENGRKQLVHLRHRALHDFNKLKRRLQTWTNSRNKS